MAPVRRAPIQLNTKETTWDRAHARFQLRSIAEAAREIRGLVTGPTPDSLSDSLDPKGATFVLPMPVLWQNQWQHRVGYVSQAAVAAEGIELVIEVIKSDSDVVHQARLDEVWSSVRRGLAQGLAIGFHSLQEEVSGGGRRYWRWELREISLVLIPGASPSSIDIVRRYSESPIRGASHYVERLEQIRSSTLPSAVRAYSPGIRLTRT